MGWCLGLLFDSSKVVHIAVVFLQMLCDLGHIFRSPLEIFAAPLLKAVDAQFAAILYNTNVLIPNWIILSFHWIIWN